MRPHSVERLWRNKPHKQTNTKIDFSYKNQENVLLKTLFTYLVINTILLSFTIVRIESSIYFHKLACQSPGTRNLLILGSLDAGQLASKEAPPPAMLTQPQVVPSQMSRCRARLTCKWQCPLLHLFCKWVPLRDRIFNMMKSLLRHFFTSGMTHPLQERLPHPPPQLGRRWDLATLSINNQKTVIKHCPKFGRVK